MRPSSGCRREPIPELPCRGRADPPPTTAGVTGASRKPGRVDDRDLRLLCPDQAALRPRRRRGPCGGMGSRRGGGDGGARSRAPAETARIRHDARGLRRGDRTRPGPPPGALTAHGRPHYRGPGVLSARASAPARFPHARGRVCPDGSARASPRPRPHRLSGMARASTPALPRDGAVTAYTIRPSTSRCTATNPAPPATVTTTRIFHPLMASIAERLVIGMAPSAYFLARSHGKGQREGCNSAIMASARAPAGRPDTARRRVSWMFPCWALPGRRLRAALVVSREILSAERPAGWCESRRRDGRQVRPSGRSAHDGRARSSQLASRAGGVRTHLRPTCPRATWAVSQMARDGHEAATERLR